MRGADQGDTARPERDVIGGGSSQGPSNVERSPEQMQVHMYAFIFTVYTLYTGIHVGTHHLFSHLHTHVGGLTTYSSCQPHPI